MDMQQNFTQTPLRFYLRNIDEPFEWRCSPLYNEQMKQELIEWAESRCNVKKGSKAYIHTIICDLPHWTALCFPLATDLPKFLNVFYFFQMFAAMDDHADESWGDGAANTGTFWNKAIALVETLRDEKPWYVKALRNILMRMPGLPGYMRENFIRMKTIMEELSPVQRNRYINCFKEYMENAALHSQMKGKEKCITMEQYKAYRVKSVASMPCTLMMEYLYNITLTDAEYHHPKLQQLEKTGTLQIALINDLFSLFKEYKGSTFENLNHVVSILVLNERMSVQEAINEVCDEIERLQDKFINIRDEWYASEVSISANVREFITGFEYYISGNARWHRLSKRYHGENFEAIITSGTMEWSPEGTIYTPD
jgi:hypothetical protein